MKEIAKLVDEKNECIRKLNVLEQWKKDAQGEGVMFVSGNMDDLENNILFFAERVEDIDKRTKELSEPGNVSKEEG